MNPTNDAITPSDHKSRTRTGYQYYIKGEKRGDGIDMTKKRNKR